MSDRAQSKYAKIRSLKKRGYSYARIKKECKCSQATITKALSPIPSIPSKKGMIPPPPPTTKPNRVSIPSTTGMKRVSSESDIWEAAERRNKQKKRPKRVAIRTVEFKAKDEFILWCYQQDPLHFTGNRRAVLERIIKHKRNGLSEGTVDLYIEFCNPKSTMDFQNDVVGELKEVLQKRKKRLEAT